MNRLLRIANTVAIPNDVLKYLEGVKILNKDTNNMILWSTAYSYDEEHQAHKDALKYLHEATEYLEKKEKERKQVKKIATFEGFKSWARDNFSLEDGLNVLRVIGEKNWSKGGFSGGDPLV